MGSINETTQPSDSTLPPNPCVRNCCLNERDICLGCGRTLQEILHWTQYSAVEKAQVLRLCQQRKR
ncbi:hypothetical protein VISI1226_12526 [Vibrio sinaloensis DSM 21326]|uniref:Fe-S protein n=1 Tax=Vibrio sinaloensis DSM 21326 TaxID=945550 RepID=E8M2V2_PHOS4|nr:DUF1289 domain-containing protein [Vibrio sinaloensis]EGA71610.1 hypothetical protein VISI1226_12526 [Vibrio sinaloensis DSM 21326]